jgi:hypothetical protein
MSKSKKRIKANKKDLVDAARIERLVYRLRHDDYRMSWYRPDNIHELPWEQIVESFKDGYNFALDAVLKALNGDGGERLQEILNSKIGIIRSADRAEHEEKKLRGLAPVYFPSRQEAEDFLKQYDGELGDEKIPLKYLN